MIAMKLGWLLLEGMLICIFLYTGNSAILAFAGALVIIPLCVLPVNLYARKHLQAHIETSGNLRKGDRGDVTVVLDNPTAFPILRICCCVEVENQLNREKMRSTVTTYAMPKKTQKIVLQTGDTYCGRIRVSISRLRLYDCFGLIPVGCKCDAVGYVTVQPDTFEQEIQILPSLSRIEDSDVYSPDRPGSDLSETFQIREYVPGDSPRQIHWKLSGKFDRLIVRDPSLPITRSVLVFWERTGGSGNAELIDAQAEVVVSLCQNLLEQSIQFTVGWNDTDRNLCVLREIHDLDELIGLMPRILRATGTKAGISGAQLLQSSIREFPAHIVYVAEEAQSEVMELQRFAQVTLLLCGKTPIEGAIQFDASNYKEQLMQIQM